MRGYLFVSNFIKLLLIYSIAAIQCLISRLYFIVNYGNLEELQQRKEEVARGLLIGFRTDTMSIAYGLLPVFIFILIQIVVTEGKIPRYLEFVERLFLCYCSTLLTVFLFIHIVDFFFYRFFNDHLNILVFALLEDDTVAIMTSLWADYPVIPIVLVIITGATVFFFLTKRILILKIKSFRLGVASTVTAILVALLLVLTALRSSWETFPLRMQNTIVSDNTFINKIGVGGVFSLQNAFKEKIEQSVNTNIETTLKQYGFKSLAEVIQANQQDTISNKKDFREYFKAKTEKRADLEARKPHVVVIQMESMSNYLLDFHSPEFNLLGDLEDELSDAYVFRNFVSASSTTISSLEGLIIGSPETPVSQSTFREQSLSTSCALPYQRAGYHTSFITGAKLAWRNLEGYLSKQYFSDIEGNASLKKINVAATEGEWGTYDEFLFDRVFQKLENANGTPQFIYAMTTSNHTPFDMPKSYQPYPLKVPDDVNRMLKVERSVAMRNFVTYQYANDCLGKFIKRIRASKLHESTIIVAFGDHSITQLFNTSDPVLLKKVSIPFIAFVPSAYKPEYKIDESRFGSHKDVFPTLFNISLSEAEYVKTGNNLLAAPSDSSYFFGVYRYNTGFSKDGCVLVDDNLFFMWKDSSHAVLEPAKHTERTTYLHQRVRAYSAAMACYIKMELAVRPKRALSMMPN